jgi:glycogen operon protein
VLRFAASLEAGRPYPLGATWDGIGVNFAVFSERAEAIDLCLFDPGGRHEIARMRLPEWTDEVWHGYLPGAQAGQLYGFRAHGPYDPHNGLRFNQHKLLLDPYARRIAGDVRWSDALFGYRVSRSNRADLTQDRRDSAAAMPKSVVADDAFTWGDDRHPDTPWPDTVIYEAHIRGLTMRRQDIPPEERGTFAALGHPKLIDDLRRLGVTAIELMPAHYFIQDRHLLERNLRNYWGYNTLGFFTPETRYLSNGSVNELKVAVRRLHAAGIEVILDVVYNHTAEGNELGPTLSFRGLDNTSYYRLVDGDPRHYVNDTGTGNTLNLSHPRVLQLVMDSLRHWVTHYRVDGFRFDLGAALGREEHGFDPRSGFFDALRQDPILARVKLISEPWDIGPGGYQLGNHPPGFAEWNDRFRDGVRQFWRGDQGQRPNTAARLAGSGDLFDRAARRPWASVNYVASHDGFTLADVVSYAQRHNEANGEDNRDGQAENYSANWGVEGPTDDPEIRAVRGRVQRAMLATLLFSLGTPMLLAGDEFGRTQNGNNNPYCQDSEISWLDWELAKAPEGEALTAFVARLIALRRAYPVLRSRNYLYGKTALAAGVLDIAWFDENGAELSREGWNNPETLRLVLRRAARTDGKVKLLTLLLNPSGEDATFRLPEPHVPTRLLIDTTDPDAAERDLVGFEVPVGAHGAALLIAAVAAEAAS